MDRQYLIVLLIGIFLALLYFWADWLDYYFLGSTVTCSHETHRCVETRTFSSEILYQVNLSDIPSTDNPFDMAFLTATERLFLTRDEQYIWIYEPVHNPFKIREDFRNFLDNGTETFIVKKNSLWHEQVERTLLLLLHLFVLAASLFRFLKKRQAD